MTDTMLRLARAVYPQHKWQQTADGEVFASFRVIPFDPANNADQFCDVLAWLVDALPDLHIAKCSVTYSRNGFHIERHDGTASGIRAAVVEAARRVVK